MKTAMLLSFLVIEGQALHSNLFTNRPSRTVRYHTTLRASETSLEAKEDLLNIADRLNAGQGVFIYDSASKSELQEAVASLEASVSSPTELSDCISFLKGDWNLVCTTATNNPGITTSNLPFFQRGPLSELRESLNDRVKVVQRIRSSDESRDIDRIDNVIEYIPPQSLDSIFSGVPDFVKGFSLNPLELTRSKLVLIHKAEVNIVPRIETKLSLQSVVLNVAGKSQYLDPGGADVLGLNIPLGDLLNAGSFETTYLDENIRISRSKIGEMLGQVRVFVRDSTDSDMANALVNVDAEEDKTSKEFDEVEWVDDIDDVPSDVE
eukprot:CAMPEP_0194223692 /NCGR_PEP_ID=MMETSP0156-20130528/35719_1 /TAXON_ID=33649 /ORGANISM="Thalassionema nitzschioides, Strain L26-B" /LENGTH=321 /DNA_ID=CAMNT_0038954931 /DNA_START=68 /DNA_END=1033 /DNA_ORIENTATION=+